MSTEHNVILIKEFEAYMEAGNTEAVLNMMTADVVSKLLGHDNYPFTGCYYSKKEAENFFATFAKAPPATTTKYEIHDYIAEGDKVVVTGYEEGYYNPSNRPYKFEWVHIYTLRNNKVSRFIVFLG